MFQTSINHNLHPCFYFFIWNLDIQVVPAGNFPLHGGRTYEESLNSGFPFSIVWLWLKTCPQYPELSGFVHLFICLDEQQSTSAPGSSATTHNLSTHHHLLQPSQEEAPHSCTETPMPWFPPTCKQLYSSGICKQLCYNWCNCSLGDSSCWGVLLWSYSSIFSVCQSILTGLLFLMVIVSPWFWLEGWRSWALQRQPWEQPLCASSASSWVNELILDRRALPLTCWSQLIDLHVTLLWQIEAAFTSLCLHLPSSFSSH